jgi:hypothetical protein
MSDWFLGRRAISAGAEIPTSRCSVHRRVAAVPSLRSVTLNSVRWTA